MKNINIHIYPSNMTNESRIFKESKFISRNCDFERIILLGIWKEGLNKDEQYEGNIYIKRVSLFNIKKRSILYLYYFMYVFVFIVLHRPKMINIHTLEFLPLSLIAKIFKIKIIYDTHELETEKANFKGFRKKISKMIEKAFIGFVDKVIVVGEAIADEYKKMYPKMDRPYVVLNTPNYKTKDLIFEDELNSATNSLKLKQTNIRHISSISTLSSSGNPRLIEVKGLEEQNDGNNVNLDTQMGEMSKNKVLFDAIQSSIKKDSRLFRSVVESSAKN